MLVRFFGGAFVGGLVLAAGALGFMASDRDVPIEISDRYLVTKTVQPGKDLLIAQHAIQHKRCEIHADRFMYDSQGVRYTLAATDFKTGIGPVNQKLNFTLKIPVPPDIAWGKARYEALVSYKCNLLHYIWPIYAPIVSFEFEVVPL